MTTEISAFISANDKANDYTKHLSVLAKDEALEEIDNLMTSTENRDIELWEELEVDANETVKDYEEADARPIEWTIGLAAIAAASTLQFALTKRDFAKAADYRLSLLDDYNLSSTELVNAGKRIVSPIEYNKVRTRITKEYANLKGLSNAELYRELRDAGVLRSIDDHVSDSIAYVTRMTDYPPGSPQFQTAVNDLINVNSERGIASINQRSVSRLTMLYEAEGDYNTQMVWMLDASASHCEYCPPNAGVVQSLNDWIAQGLPGAATCKGGDRCKCMLMRADAKEPVPVPDEIYTVRRIDKGDGSFKVVYF